MAFTLDMQLLGDEFAHAMQRMAAARTGLLIVGKVIFNALAGANLPEEVYARASAFGLFHLWQSRVGKLSGVGLVTVGQALISIGLESGVLGFIEDAIHMLFRCAAQKRCSCASASSSSSLKTRCSRALSQPAARRSRQHSPPEAPSVPQRSRCRLVSS
ncbi:hypothetical protein ACOJBO_02145 [Rhizobium beringeri]